MSCSICNARGHNTSKCPKKEKEPTEGGRGLTQGNDKDLAALVECLKKLDVEAMYDKGAKSLVGGYKGKPSGLKDTSYRIDRQGLGNVQFQHGEVSLAKVTFQPDTKPAAIIHALKVSLKTCEEVDL